MTRALVCGLGAAIDVIVWDWLLVGADLRLCLIHGATHQADNSGGSIHTDMLVLLGARL